MRMSERFEKRVLDILHELMTAKEVETIDWEVATVVFPQQQPNGQVTPALGFNIALSSRTVVITDHLLMMDLCQDPYKPDADLKLQVQNILTSLREMLARINAEKANGTSGRSSGGLILPGRG